jgi:hypothetical protein
VKDELQRLEIPGEHEARLRTWKTVEAAYAAHEPQPPRWAWKPILALTVVAALTAGLASPPGRAVLSEIRETVGVETAQPALFSLPTSGRLLVTASSGAWVVETDGSKRRLGGYREASWSPFGRYVVASHQNELVALTPQGEVRWSLARPEIRFPRWGGSRTDTRIAYLSDGELRVVAGDGTGDHLIERDTALKPPVWQRGPGHRLAYARRDGSIRIVDADTGAILDRNAPEAVEPRPPPDVVVRTIGLGEGANPVYSPDGRWAAVAWPEANQFVFVRVAGSRQIQAVSDVAAQFHSSTFPQISGWAPAAE